MINSNSDTTTENSDSSKDHGFIKNKIKKHFTDEELENNSIFGLLDIRTKRYLDQRQIEQDTKRLDVPGQLLLNKIPCNLLTLYCGSFASMAKCTTCRRRQIKFN